jgi:hypothetical protein
MSWRVSRVSFRVFAAFSRLELCANNCVFRRTARKYPLDAFLGYKSRYSGQVLNLLGARASFRGWWASTQCSRVRRTGR